MVPMSVRAFIEVSRGHERCRWFFSGPSRVLRPTSTSGFLVCSRLFQSSLPLVLRLRSASACRSRWHESSKHGWVSGGWVNVAQSMNRSITICSHHQSIQERSTTIIRARTIHSLHSYCGTHCIQLEVWLEAQKLHREIPIQVCVSVIHFTLFHHYFVGKSRFVQCIYITGGTRSVH